MGKPEKHPEAESGAASVKGRASGGAQVTSASLRKHGKEAVVRCSKASRTSGPELEIHGGDGRLSVPRYDGSDAVSHLAKSERIELRTTPDMKVLLERAAATSRKNVAEFLIEAGAGAAEETLANHHILWMDDAQWRDFHEMLDRPVTHKPRLARLLARQGLLG